VLWRPAARLLTGPLAFFLAGAIDVLAFVLGSWRERLRRRFSRR
jgi:hypothetical protein